MREKLIPKTFSYIKPGDTYGRLTVTGTYVVEKTYRYMATCDCSCGTKDILVRIDGLRAKKRPSTSCGCAQKDATTKHGLFDNPLYKVWTGMMSRCYKKTDRRYADWGGKGITVCDRWHEVANFVADMGEGYEHGLQIDRIDNEKGYFPENCRWATRKQQARNKSNNRLLTLNGETKCMGEWAEITGICVATLWDRKYVRGWSDEKILTTPPMSHTESILIARNTRYKKL